MIESYDDAIAYLERLVATPVRGAPEAKLARARALLARAGDPQGRFATLHVTGSAGKGSTAALSAGILRAAGYRTGLFTSPHLRDYTERIAVDGAPIARADWARLLEKLRPAIEDLAADRTPGYTLGRPAFMEVLWALAALYFAERAVDIAVVEVGRGGRYDPTTVNSARVGIITSVSLEHAELLGPTLADIARHKAGIAKPGGIVVTAATEATALRIIAEECARLDALLWRVTAGEGDGEVRYAAEDDPSGFRIATPAHEYVDLPLGLLGPHQRANAACAVGAIDALGVLGVLGVARAGGRADEVAVRRALAATRVPGRLEWMGDDPRTLLDGAHSAGAARALAVALPALLPGVAGPRGEPGGRAVFLLGILGDKDIAAMVGALTPFAAAVVVTEPPWERRAGGAHIVMEELLRRVPAPDVAFVPDHTKALARAQELARAHGLPLVVTGSLILIGAVRPLL